MSKMQLKAGELSVLRNGQQQVLTTGDALQYEDEVINSGSVDAVVEILPMAEGQTPSLLKIEPEATAKFQKRLDTSTGIEQAEVVPTCPTGVSLDTSDEELASAVLIDNENCAMLGLAGSGLLAAGSGPLGAIAAVGGLIALSGGGSSSAASEDDPNMPPASPADSSGGLAGTVDALSESTAQTPLAPVSSVLEPVSGALAQAGDALKEVSANDPTGVTGLLAEVVGVPAASAGSEDQGLVGGVNSLATAVDKGTAGTPLEALGAPLATTVGSDQGATTGVASGLAGVGTVLLNDSSALAPVTSDLLGPVAGGDETGTQGVPATLDETSAGLESLTAQGPLEPLAPVTAGAAQGLAALSEGLSTAGAALDEQSAADPSGVVETLAEVLGAPVEPKAPDSTESGADESTVGLAGTVADVSKAIEPTPLEPLTAATTPLADGLLTVGEAVASASEQDPSGLTTVLGTLVGSNAFESSGDTGLVGGVNALSTGLDKGTENTPLAEVVDPLSRTLGSDEGQTTGTSLGLAELGGVLLDDASPLAPVTSDVLGPVVGTSNNTSADNDGLPGTLTDVGLGLEELTTDSALEPLSPVTEGLSTAVDTLAEGLDSAGTALAENAGADPTGTLAFLADVLGGNVATQPEQPSEPTPPENIDGLSGLLNDLGSGLSQTPLEPLTALTDPLSSGFLQVGDTIAEVSAQDPSGLTPLLGHVFGTSDSSTSADTGLVGGLNGLATGLDKGTQGGPLEVLIDPVADLVGSQEGATSGLAAGVGALGTTLALDDSVLSPLTSGLLSPVVGQSQGVESGLPSTLDKAADGLTDLTSQSALEPLAPVTMGASAVVKAVANGCRGVGRGISDFSDRDPSGIADLLGDVCGGGRGRGRSIGRRDLDDDLFSSSLDFSQNV
ncbi:MAG: hypothetical protein QE278_05880 [Limnobacter sp.]|nr:hypothetical protein [Limnobacter sp.]